MPEPKPGKYLHYKGKEVEVMGIARHSENLENFVVYRHLTGGKELWIRPKKMFMEKVKKDGKKVLRFKYLGEK